MESRVQFFFLSAPIGGGETETRGGGGLQEGRPRQPDIKMVQESSGTSQVAAGQTMARGRGGREKRSFLKANGLSMDVL